MRLLITSVFSFIFLSSCMVGIRGNGKVQSEDRPVESFSRIDVSAGLKVDWVPAERFLVQVEADENLLEVIETVVEGNKLYIRTKANIQRAKKQKVTVYAPHLKEIEISGAVDLEAKGIVEEEYLKIEASGASQIELELIAQELDLELSGASRLEFRGEVSSLKLHSSGASVADLEDLRASRASVDLSGASVADLWVKDELRISASGASVLNYKGNARVTRQELSGASAINHKND